MINARSRYGEELDEVVDGPPVPGDVHHGPHEVTDHVVKESVGRDLEGKTQPLPGNPTGLRHHAPVPPGFLPDFREGPERMFSEEQGRALVEEVHIHLTDERPAPGPLEGGEGQCGESELVTVASGLGRVPGMEIRGRPHGPIPPRYHWAKRRSGPVGSHRLPISREASPTRPGRWRGHRYRSDLRLRPGAGRRSAVPGQPPFRPGPCGPRPGFATRRNRSRRSGRSA